MSLIKEKVNQAIEILKEQQTDMWLTFVRETSGVRDPALDFLIGPGDLTWLSALILTRKGEKIAIVGNRGEPAREFRVRLHCPQRLGDLGIGLVEIARTARFEDESGFE